MRSNIRKLRYEKQISQTTLGEILGKTQQTVSHMELDRDKIPIESLITMADYFGVSTDYILGLDENENGSSKKDRSDEAESALKEADAIKRLAENIDSGTLYDLALALILCSLREKSQEPSSTR